MSVISCIFGDARITHSYVRCVFWGVAIVAACSHQADASSHRPRRKDNSCHSSLLSSSCWLWGYLWVSRNSPAAASVSVTQGKLQVTAEQVSSCINVPSAFYIYWCTTVNHENWQAETLSLVLVSHFCLLWGRCLHKCLWGPSLSGTGGQIESSSRTANTLVMSSPP